MFLELTVQFLGIERMSDFLIIPYLPKCMVLFFPQYNHNIKN